MQVRSLGWRTDLTLRRLAGAQVADRGDHLVVRTRANPHFWWGNFLLLAAPPTAGAAPGWLERFTAEFPHARHVALGIDTPPDTRHDDAGHDDAGHDDAGHEAVGRLAWFAAHGFEVQAAEVLTAARVRPPRRVHRAALCRPLVGDADWAASRALEIRLDDSGVGPADVDAFCTAEARARRRLTEAGHGGWFGAFLGDRLVSQLGLIDAGDGLARFQSVGTDPDFVRQGLAGTLVHHAARWGLDELGARTLVMVADPGYWAIELYRRVGFARTGTQLQMQRKPDAVSG